MSMFRTTITSHHRLNGRPHVAVNWSRHGWVLQNATPTQHGYSFGPPIAGPFRTKREAVEAKRAARVTP